MGAVRDDPVSKDEIRLMMAWLLRSPEVAGRATGTLPDGDLIGMRISEEPLELLWDAYRQQLNEAGSQPPLEVVRIRALGKVEQNFSRAIVSDVRSEINAVCEYVRGLPEATFADPSVGLGLLRHFLTERVLREEMRQIGNGTGDIDLRQLDDFRVRIDQLGHSTGAAPLSLSQQWTGYAARLALYRSRLLLGIATGWPQFDQLSLGLRGVVLLTAKPGAGKSSFFMHGMLGAVRHNEGVCGVYVSLEMDRELVLQRIHAHLSELPLATVLRGSPGRRGATDGVYFTPEDQAKLDRARTLIVELGPRLLILDRADLGGRASVEAIRSLVTVFKRSCGAENAVVVLDYLSLLDVPSEFNRSENEADKWRITEARRIVDETQTAGCPEGDALLVICESRKPANSRDGEWGEGLADYMGSARLTYAAEMALNFRSLSNDEVQARYGQRHPGRSRKEILDVLEREGTAPLVLAVTKARGASKGEIAYEYRFHEYIFVELPALSREEQRRRQDQQEASAEQAVRDQVKGLVLDAVGRTGDVGVSLKAIRAAIGPATAAAKLRGFDLRRCLDELVRDRALEAYEGPNANGTGKAHSRWRVPSAPETHATPAPRTFARRPGTGRGRGHRSANGTGGG